VVEQAPVVVDVVEEEVLVVELVVDELEAVEFASSPPHPESIAAKLPPIRVSIERRAKSFWPMVILQSEPLVLG
jgi:hypothetical protein